MVACVAFVSRAAADPGPVNGSMFLTSQLGYLRGVDCTRDVEVHLLCQERFDQDWAALLRSFGEHTSRPGGWHSHLRNASRAPRLNRAHWQANARSMLSSDDDAFVRRALYPWDDALHKWACGDSSSIDPNVPFVLTA